MSDFRRDLQIRAVMAAATPNHAVQGTRGKRRAPDGRRLALKEQNMTPLERITTRVTRLGHPDEPHTPRPLVTVDEFLGLPGFRWLPIGC